MEQNQLYLIKSGQNSFVETEGEVTIGLSGGNIGFGTTAPEAFMHVTGNTQIDGDLTVKGDFTTVNSTTIQVDDKNIEIGVGATSDAAADGGGITLHGATNKTITWSDANDAWTSSEHVHTADGKHVATDQVRALDGDGLKLYDDGGNGIFVEDGGNVGVGTTNPTVALDVVGSGNFSASVSAGSSVDATTTMSAGTSLTTPLVKAAGAAGLNLQDDGGNGIFVEDGGNVGIGTSDPSVALDVVGAGSFSTSVSAGSSVDATTTMSAGTSLTTPLVKAADGNGLNLQDDGGNGIFVEDGGNVGIGTSDPSATLDVVGSGNFSAGLYVNGKAVVTGDAGKWSDGVGANEIYYSAGNVGVGTSDPSSALDVVGVGNFSQGLFVGGNAVVTGSAGKWSDGVGTDEIYYSAANVGIGTSDPAASLDVGGLFQVGSNGTIGGVSPSSDHVIKWNGSKWISATSPGGGGAGSSEVPSAFTTNLLSSNGAIHQISFAETYDSIPSIATDLEVTEGPIIPYAISGLSTAGYYAVFTQDIPSDNNYKIHTTFGGKEVYWATGVASTAVVYDGGNVGIGTTDPSVALDVVGAGSFSTSVSAGTSVSATTTMSAGTSLTTPLVKAAGGAGLNLQDDGGNGLFIKDGGNVGIGTTNPDWKLKIVTTSSAADGIAVSNGTNTTSLIGKTAAGAGFVTLYDDGSAPGAVINGANAVSYFAANGGNVGIGTKSPGGLLDVNSTSGDSTLLVRNNTQTLRFDQNSIRTTTNNDLSIFTNGNGGQIYLQQASGNVGIGTTDPGTRVLKVFGTSSQTSIWAENQHNSAGWGGLITAAWANTTGDALTLTTRNAYLGTYRVNTGVYAAGVLVLKSRNGTSNYLWSDDSGVLRLGVSASNIGSGTGTAIATAGTSDERLKNIEDDFEYGLSHVLQLQPIAFTFKNDKEAVRKLGFGAQTSQSIIPESVYDSGNCIDGYDDHPEHEGINVPKSDDNELGMEYTQLIPVLTKAIQEQQQIIEDLKSRIETLEQ